MSPRSSRRFRAKAIRARARVSLRVQATGDHFVVIYDGKTVLDARDGTFKDAGKIGLWTKADSVIYFDDLQVKDLATPAAAAPSAKILGQRLVDDLADAHPELVLERRIPSKAALLKP